MEQTECSETLAYKFQTPGNYPEENIQHYTLCLLDSENFYVSGSLLFILWMTVFLFVMSHLVVLQFSEQTDVLGTHSSPFSWLVVTLLSKCVHCHDIVCVNMRNGIYSSFEQQKSKIFLSEGYEYFDKCLQW